MSGLGTRKRIGKTQKIIRKSGPIEWAGFPEKRVYSIEIASDPDAGKTHACATFPGVAIADTPSENKAEIVFKKFNNPKIYKIATFDDFRQFVSYCCDDDSIQTIAVDSGSDLVDLASEEYKQEAKKEAIFPIFQYRHVYNKIDEVIKQIKDAQKYFVTTCRLKDEYRGTDERAVKTGKRIRQGYTKFYYGLSIMIELQNGIRDDKTGRLWFPDHIFGKVVKNNFLCKRVQKPFVFNPTFQGFEEELFTPYCTKYVKTKCENQNCLLCVDYQQPNILQDAEKWLQGKGLISKPQLTPMKEVRET